MLTQLIDSITITVPLLLIQVRARAGRKRAARKTPLAGIERSAKD